MGAERPPLSHAAVLGRWVSSFVNELVAAGLRDVCLCPGSRSTPLALTLARHPHVRVWTHLDERSCAYFALGMAKVSTRPIAILCSSGTAAVNFAPAVVEAFHSRVPLLVLTADRPPELQELGANQTIDQHRLYGRAVKWFSQMPLPEASDEMLRYARMIAGRAVSAARERPAGPVHLNFAFREPLIPAPLDFSPSKDVTTEDAAVTIESPAVPVPDLPERLNSVERGVIVCGPNAQVEPEKLLGLAERLGYPVLADPLSGLRGAVPCSPNVFGAYDCYLRSPAVVATLQPEFVLRFGDPPTSKPLATYLQRYRHIGQLQVSPPGAWSDPDLTADRIIHVDATRLCDSLLAGLRDGANELNTWLNCWQDIEARTRETTRSELSSEHLSNEVSAIVDLEEALPEGATVIAGNSMPVRDLDTFFGPIEKPLTLLGNRGASGIDGVVSTALGVAAAQDGRVVLVIGDLSFYHDMNGLLAARRHNLNATIVLINNDGGGIFSFLPQHDDAEHFEMLFGTPHGLDFSHVAELYGVGFRRVTRRDEYRQALRASFDEPGVHVIEVRTDREENLKLHQRIWEAVARELEAVVSA